MLKINGKGKYKSSDISVILWVEKKEAGKENTEKLPKVVPFLQEVSGVLEKCDPSLPLSHTISKSHQLL